MTSTPLHMEDAWLASVIESIADGVVVVAARDGVHLLVNNAFCTMSGFLREELLGQGLPHPYWPPEEMDSILPAYEEALSGPHPVELVFCRRNGERFPVRVSPAHVTVGGHKLIVATVQDETVARARRDKLAFSQQLVETMVRGGDMAWWMWDVTENRARASDSYFEMLGYLPGAWNPTYEEWARRVHPDDIGAADQKMQALLADKLRLYDAEHRVKDADGEWRWVLSRGWVVQRLPDGSPQSVMGTHQDVHRLRTQETALRQFQKMEVVGQMAGGFAHDVNNLLTILKGNLDLVREDAQPALMTYLEEMDDVLRRASGLTKSLLQLGLRKDQEALEVVDLNHAFSDLEKLVASVLPGHFDLCFEPLGVPCQAEIDRGRFENAVLNLVVNAKDAMPHGGRIVVRLRTAVIGPAEAKRLGLTSGGFLIVSVEDEGKGIPEELKERIFEPLFTTKPLGKGTGLGLSIVRRFATDMGGAVTLSSEVGRGTAVAMYFPRVIYPVQQADDPTPVFGPPGHERLLVVDDDPAVARLVSGYLCRLGYSVTECVNPRQALARLAESDFDLLLTDIVMPFTIDGVELARRAKLLRPALKVLFISGYADEAQRALVHALGVLLKKPFLLGELATMVRRVIDEDVRRRAFPVASKATPRDR